MKQKKTIWVVLITLALLILVILGSFLIWVVPKNMGPIEPFLNLGDSLRRVTGRDRGGEVNIGEQPGKPAYYQIGPDCTTGDLVSPGELIEPDSGCDIWEINRYERPFNAISQDEFLPDLDIQYAYFGRDSDWYYLRMALYDPQPGMDYLSGTYALEMDLDLDGRGDILVMASQPGKTSGKKWSTQGVQIWVDTNNDVGGELPNIPEALVSTDGYDTLLFDQGTGKYTNGAWSRVFLSGSAYLELAFKKDFLDGDLTFKWWVWSGHEVYSSDRFDLHDFYTKEQSGSPNSGLDSFPIKEVFALDNSCASMWGADPDPNDPDFCPEISVPDYDYNTCIMLKCAIPMLPCRIPPDLPGDDPCVLNFEQWLYSIWIPTHPGENDPPEEVLWSAYAAYLKDPFCPPEGLVTPSPTPTYTLTPTDTLTPTPTDTLTPTPTDTLTPTPTDTPTPIPPGCNYNCGCEPDLGESVLNCPDCPQHCGNGICDCTETYQTCSQDCKPEIPQCKSGLTEPKCIEAGGTWTTSPLGPSTCVCP